ncbi:hypothetical protein BC828DRAFT_415417 [Blastocladiella britannica]|nr:hypothetical protein BC828DRAFT_415417 [Blastocladiella britannica]
MTVHVDQSDTEDAWPTHSRRRSAILSLAKHAERDPNPKTMPDDPDRPVPTSLDAYLAPYTHLVSLAEHPSPGRTDRVLIAAKDFAVGEVVFSEPALLDSAHQIAQEFLPVPFAKCHIAPDFQRLLFEYIARAVYSPGLPVSVMLELVRENLSTDGMTSSLAARVSTARIAQYTAGVKVFRDTVKKRLARRASVAMTGAFPTQDTLLKLLYAIETNVHSTDLPTAHPQAADEDHLTVGLLASLPDHACRPNTVLSFFPPVPPTVDDSDGEIDPSAQTHLLFTAVRPIAQGQVIAIAYQENSWMPTQQRRAELARRGFACNCPMCAGPDRDFARAVVCPHCPGGIALPSPMGPASGDDAEVAEELEDEYEDKDEEGGLPPVQVTFPTPVGDEFADAPVVCTQCGQTATTESALAAAETRLHEDPDARLDVLGRLLDLVSHHVPASTEEQLTAAHLVPIIVQDAAHDAKLAALLTIDGRACLSVAHFLVYDMVRTVLFHDSDAIDRTMHLPAVLYLVACNYAAIPLADRDVKVNAAWMADETAWTKAIAWCGDVAHNLEWLMKVGRARNNMAITQWASDRGMETAAAMGIAGKTSGIEDGFINVFSRPRESVVFFN